MRSILRLTFLNVCTNIHIVLSDLIAWRKPISPVIPLPAVSAIDYDRQITQRDIKRYLVPLYKHGWGVVGAWRELDSSALSTEKRERPGKVPMLARRFFFATRRAAADFFGRAGKFLSTAKVCFRNA